MYFQVFVEFAQASQAVKAFGALGRKTFNGHSVILTYFPLEFWENSHFLWATYECVFMLEAWMDHGCEWLEYIENDLGSVHTV